MVSSVFEPLALRLLSARSINSACSRQERPTPGHHLDALDAIRDELELVNAVIDVVFVLHNVGRCVVRHELPACCLHGHTLGQMHSLCNRCHQ